MKLFSKSRVFLSACVLAGGLLGAHGCKSDHSAAKAKWQDKANWSQIKPGMNTDQVRALLGDPTSSHSDPVSIRWTFGEGENAGIVSFFAAGTIKDWHAPP